MSVDDEQAIRLDERRKLAKLLREHSVTIENFVGDKARTIRLITFLIELGT